MGAIQRNWQHRIQGEDKQNKTPGTMNVGRHYAQANTNNVDKT